MDHGSRRPRPRSPRLWLLLVAALLGAGLMALSTGVAFAATGSMSGTVTDKADNPLHSIVVSVYPQTYSGGPATGTATTAADGTYTIAALASGSYWVEFYDSTGTYASQIYDDRNLGGGPMDYVTVTAGSTTTEIDAALPLAGKISGTVVDGNGIPLTTVWACVYVNGAGGYFANHPAGADGTYTIGGLAPGSYNVEFIDFAGKYSSQWYADQADQSGAAVITVSGGSTVFGVDAVMQPAPGAVIGPMNALAPTVSGTAAPGQTLTCSSGTWSGVPAPTYTYQWLRDGVPIGEATNSDYQVQGSDCGCALSCQITASNSGGTAIAASNSVQVPQAPQDSTAPVISGTPSLGKTLSCTSGTWQASPTAGYAYQWLRSGQAITGATMSNYTVHCVDCGHKLSCRVTATNSAGSGVATSQTVTVRPAPAPTLRVSPTKVSVGKLVTITGTVRYALSGARTVTICRRISGRNTGLKRLTVSSSGRFHWAMKARKAGTWRLVVTYRAAGLIFSSKAVVVTIRR
jgi:hypothetical protein